VNCVLELAPPRHSNVLDNGVGGLGVE